jgi:F-type H+-transporting ATPase subunit gamma
MEALQALGRKIRTLSNLLSIVKTMKSLAAAGIRQYERAAEAVAEYGETVEAGFQIVLKRGEAAPAVEKRKPAKRAGAVVFGSDLGLCGMLNERVASYARERLNTYARSKEIRLIVVGARTLEYLGEGISLYRALPTPASVVGIGGFVSDILMDIERWHSEEAVDEVFLFYSRHAPETLTYSPSGIRLMPFDIERLRHLSKKPWGSRAIPQFTADLGVIMSSLVREYLFVSIYTAMAESLASESISRLVAMQRAERNIEDRLTELSRLYHQQRQATIDAELLDIVSGFEALMQGLKLT